MTSIRGVILCGGQSIRMGTDKGMIKSGNKSWALTAADKLSTLGINVCCSVNEVQFKIYSSVFNETCLIKDNGELKIKGPLAGILSVHNQYPNDDLLVLACDIPLMEHKMLKKILSSYDEHPSADAYVFLNDGGPEPLCAIYAAKGLSYILQLLKTNKLSKHSMKFMLTKINTFTIPLVEDQKKYFRNFNSQMELDGL